MTTTATSVTTTTIALNSAVYSLELTYDSNTGYAFGCVPTVDSPGDYTYFLLLTNIVSTPNSSSSNITANSSVTFSSNKDNTFGNTANSSDTYILSVAAGGGGGGGYIYSSTNAYGGNGGSGGNLIFSNITSLLGNSYSFGIGVGGVGGGSVSSGYWGGSNTIKGPQNMIASPSTYNIITNRIPSFVNSGAESSITNSSSGCSIVLAGGNGGYCWTQTLKHDTPGNTAYTIPYPSYSPFDLITGISSNETYTSAGDDNTGGVSYGGQATHTLTPFHGGMGISFGLGYNNGSTLEGVMPFIPCFAVSSTYFNNPNSGHPVNFGGGGGGGAGSTNSSYGYGVYGAYTSNSSVWEQFYNDSSYYYAGKGGNGSTTGYNGQSGASQNGSPIYFGLNQTPIDSSPFYNCYFSNLGGGGGGGGAYFTGSVFGTGSGGNGANGFTLLIWSETVNGVPSNCSNNIMFANMPANGGTGPN